MARFAAATHERSRIFCIQLIPTTTILQQYEQKIYSLLTDESTSIVDILTCYCYAESVRSCLTYEAA